MPRLGDSVAEGTLVRWLVRPGAMVRALDVIAEVDTDKVSAEIPAPVGGTVRALLADEGQSVKIGAEIAVIETETKAPVVERATGGNTTTPRRARAGPR